MSQEFEPLFVRLREILRQQSKNLSIKTDTAKCYALEAPIGPATLRAWGGKIRQPEIQVAWVQMGKSYVSFHLMGLYGNDELRHPVSKTLQARMQGKSCFNFKNIDEKLFSELEDLTARVIREFRKAGYII